MYLHIFCRVCDPRQTITKRANLTKARNQPKFSPNLDNNHHPQYLMILLGKVGGQKKKGLGFFFPWEKLLRVSKLQFNLKAPFCAALRFFAGKTLTFQSCSALFSLGFFCWYGQFFGAQLPKQSLETFIGRMSLIQLLLHMCRRRRRLASPDS